MERITVRIPQDKIDELDAEVEQRSLPNRSEAVRRAIDIWL